jgi:hypothetical protein
MSARAVELFAQSDVLANSRLCSRAAATGIACERKRNAGTVGVIDTG